MRTEHESNREAKAILDRLSIDLARKLIILDNRRRQVARLRVHELRSIEALHKSIHTHSGHLESAVPTSGKEAEEIRRKHNFNPRMTFGCTDFQAGLTAAMARQQYRLNYDVDHVIERHNSKKKLTWPNTQHQKSKPKAKAKLTITADKATSPWHKPQ